MHQPASLLALLLALTLLALPLNAEEHSPGSPAWSYSGENGPSEWYKLAPAFSIMKDGKRQSPIDIQKVNEVEGNPLVFHYEPSKLNLVNNGHSIQQNYDPGSYILYQGKRYALLQFHFHQGSEHTLDGQQYAMEMHLVHASPEGKLLVVGILLERGLLTHPFLTQFWSKMPRESGATTTDESTQINVADIIPQDSVVYHYSGSLTTPPGIEGVEWFVYEKAQSISPLQVLGFKKRYAGNFRPPQPIHQRSVTAYAP